RRSLSGYGIERLASSMEKDFELSSELVEHLLCHVGLTQPAQESQNSQDLRRSMQAHFDSVMVELGESLSYAAHQYPDAPVERVLVCGGGSGVPGLEAYLAASLNLAVHVVRSAEVMAGALASNDPAADSGMILAIGLGLFQE